MISAVFEELNKIEFNIFEVVYFTFEVEKDKAVDVLTLPFNNIVILSNAR